MVEQGRLYIHGADIPACTSRFELAKKEWQVPPRLLLTRLSSSAPEERERLLGVWVWRLASA